MKPTARALNFAQHSSTTAERGPPRLQKISGRRLRSQLAALARTRAHRPTTTWPWLLTAVGTSPRGPRLRDHPHLTSSRVGLATPGRSHRPIRACKIALAGLNGSWRPSLSPSLPGSSGRRRRPHASNGSSRKSILACSRTGRLLRRIVRISFARPSLTLLIAASCRCLRRLRLQRYAPLPRPCRPRQPYRLYTEYDRKSGSWTLAIVWSALFAGSDRLRPTARARLGQHVLERSPSVSIPSSSRTALAVPVQGRLRNPVTVFDYQ